jgi:hypothetical protein
MTPEEFNTKKIALKKELEEKIRELSYKCALENNKHKIGDIIEDHIGKGRIIKTSGFYYNFNGFPLLVYSCENLLKNGDVSKKEPKRAIYEENIK